MLALRDFYSHFCFLSVLDATHLGVVCLFIRVGPTQSVKMRMVWRLVLGLLAFWIIILLYMSSTLYQSSSISDKMELKLTKAMEELEDLKNRNRILHNLAKELK